MSGSCGREDLPQLLFLLLEVVVSRGAPSIEEIDNLHNYIKFSFRLCRREECVYNREIMKVSTGEDHMEQRKRTAFVSGASRGIGKAIAEKLAEEGCDLALTCEKRIDALKKLAEELEDQYGVKVLALPTDMGDAAAVAAMGERVLQEFGAVDLVVNNAGISMVGLVTDLTVEQWQRIVNVNLSSLFYTTKAFVPGMVHRKSGGILNISSMWGSVGASCEVAYSATKGGVNSYTRALAKELAPSGIRVNALACGCIDTDMNRVFSEEERAALAEEIPMGRFAKPSEVAQAAWDIMNLTYVTGQILGVDGAYL